MSDWKTGRTMQPRPQLGTSLLAAMQVMATDEGIYLARVAFRRPEDHKVVVCHWDKVMWQGGTDDVQHFAACIGGSVVEAVEWTVA